MSDESVLSKSVAENRILITNDKDFGELIFREGKDHCGVVLLRLEIPRAPKKIDVLKRVIEDYADQLAHQFVVVTERQVRIVGGK